MRQLWQKYIALLDSDINARIFDNIKNLLACAILFAAGTAALHGDHTAFMGLVASNTTGWGLIAFSGVLMVMNISDGIHKLAKLRYHVLLQISLFIFYIVLSLRVVEVVWSFRA